MSLTLININNIIKLILKFIIILNANLLFLNKIDIYII